MLELEQICNALDLPPVWEKRADGFWLEATELDVQKMAHVLGFASARLVTITATPDADAECRVAYHWDIDGTLVTLLALTHAQSIASIAAICPAADWIEREIHDYFAINFTGRADLPPLVLRDGDHAGLWKWRGAQ